MSKCCSLRQFCGIVAVLCAWGAGWAHADPPVPEVDLPTVFCFRVTDMERVLGDAEGDAFRFEFEVLNWANQEAFGLDMALNQGTSPGVSLVNATIDADGRGGPVGGSDIGPGTFDPTGIHSGRGRGDVAGYLNDWHVDFSSGTSAQWTAVDGGGFPDATPIPDRDLIGEARFGGGDASVLVPGLGDDALGDSAIDGGPIPYTPASPGGGQPVDGSGNVLDGFVLEVDGFGVGDTLSLNWFLLGSEGEIGELPQVGNGNGNLNNLFPIGTANFGNSFGFGTFSLARLNEDGSGVPGPLFVGNTGFTQSPFLFYGDVFNIPNPASFGGELGAGLTAPFVDPDDNIFGAAVNAVLIPEPASLPLLLFGLLSILACRRCRSLRRR